MSEPTLSQRQIRTYNRFQQQLSVLLFAMRAHKTGPVGATAVNACNDVIAHANQAFARMPGLPRFAPLPAGTVLTQHDLTLTAYQLAAVALDFEARYQHLTIPPMPPRPAEEAPPVLDADGLPDKHLYRY